MESRAEDKKNIEHTGINTDKNYKGYASYFSKKDSNKTVLIPWFTDFLSPFIPAVAKLAGYNFVNCPKTSKQSADIGLKYGNNEVCFPATLILGDLIAEIQTGKHDLDNLAVAITQTGGQCRATNYLGMIKNGLKNAGFEKIPVISVTLGDGVHQNEQEGFDLPVAKIFNISMNAWLFGDAINQMFASTVVREKEVGSSQKVFDKYIAEGIKIIEQNKPKKFYGLMNSAVDDFNAIEVYNKKYEKVGLIGEIFVKYNSYGQMRITEWLRKREIEVVTPPMVDFLMQTFVNKYVNDEHGIKKISRSGKILLPLLRVFVEHRTSRFEKICKRFNFYHRNDSIFAKASYAKNILNLSNQFGEGWMIAGEVASFARNGVDRVVCVQPFGCIANHIVAKGIERSLKEQYPTTSLLFLDIDGGISEVNIHNRLEFLIC